MPETTSTQTGSERVRHRPDTRARTRWLAVPRVRFHGTLGGPSQKTQEPARGRCDGQPDNSLLRLSWQMSRRASIETTLFLSERSALGTRRGESHGRDCYSEVVRSVGNSGREEASRDWRGKPNLISATIGRDTIGSEAALQLSLPVWQCNAKGLNQAGVRKN